MTDHETGQDAETQTNVKTHFINRLKGVFKRAPGSDEHQYLRTIKSALEKYPPDILHEAAQRIVESATTQTYPLPAVCIQTVQTIQAERRALEREKETSAKPASRTYDHWLPDNVAIEIAITQNRDLIRRAMRDDWHVPLIDYVREHRELPDDRTCRHLEITCAEFNERAGKMVADAEAALRESLGTKAEHLTQLPDKHPIMRFYNAIMNRRDKFKRQILEQLGELSEAAE